MAIVVSGYLALAAPVESIELIRSADQSEITSQSLHYESMQHSSYSNWKVAQDNLATKQLAKTQAEAEFKRIERLYEQGIANENSFRKAELDFSTAESDLNLQIAKVQSAASDVRQYQLLLLSEGNPENDYRRDVAINLREKYQAELELLSARMRGARGALSYYHYQLDITQKLFDKGLRTKREVERWEFFVQSQSEKIDSIQHQVDSANSGIAGVNKAMERL